MTESASWKLTPQKTPDSESQAATQSQHELTMKHLLLNLITVLCVFAPLRDTTAAEPSKPNIIVIFTDDHGWADLGANGADKHIRTPNTDQLARDGVRFSQGYDTAPQCTPSRAGLMSGQYQSRIGVEQNGIPMRSEVVTLPERLKQAGYVTGISGKWHLDVEDQRKEGGRKNVKHPDLGPWAHGFDEYFTGVMQDYEASHALDGTPYPDAPKNVREEGCRVVLQTEWALQFLKRRAAEAANSEPNTANRKPFFLYISYMAPHTPLEWPEPFIQQVPENLPKERRSALALIAAIDDGVGRVREQLSAMGQEEHTLIFYLGDNGAPLAPINPREGQRSPWDGSINLPMRGQKGMLSEGGIRVPSVCAWPGRIPGGQVFDHPVISLDIAATSVAAAGLPMPKELDGADLLPHLAGKKTGPPHETLYWRWVDQAAILEHPHKLLLPGGAEPLLFDVTDPDHERLSRNLSQKKPDVAARLRKKLDVWLATLKPPGQPQPLVPHRLGNFIDYELLPPSAELTGRATVAEPEGSIQGWICRNGTIAIDNEALAVTPTVDLAKNARPFLSRTGLDLAGPVTVKLRTRATQGGPSTITWRTRTSGFTPEQSVSFQWPTGPEWQDVTLELPEKGRLIHLRVTPPRTASATEIDSIEIRGARGPAITAQFKRQP